MLKTRRGKLLCAASFILGASLSLIATAVVGSLAGHYFRYRSDQSIDQTSDQAGTPPRCGRIEAIEIPLANGDGVFPEREQRLASPRWFFENVSEKRLTRFLDSCDLRPSEQRMLLDKRGWQILTNGVVITPPEQLIWSLKPQSREQIYSILAKSPTNFPQCFPFRFSLAGFEQRFKHSDLPFGDIEKIRRLTYTNSGYLCFTDLHAAKGALTPGGFNDLIETLYQVPSYMLRLRVAPDSDIEALVKYWGKGGREKLIAPLLTSLAKVPGGAAFNISYFLPPFARLRLYTYPYTWNDQAACKEDCFFTSMNFFSERPDTNFFDRVYTAKVLHSEYVPVREHPSFGDVVALFSATGEIFHTCVYIADDFVFTKNGVNPEQPWVLMRMADMLMLYYPTDRSGHLGFLRRKDMT